MSEQQQAPEIRQLLDDLDNLHYQATKERSHYYVGSRCKQASETITRLQQANAALVEREKKLTEALSQTRSWIVRSGVQNPSAIIDSWIDPALASQ